MFDQFLEDFKADAFVEFARSNLAFEENKMTGFLSSELARADRGEILVGHQQPVGFIRFFSLSL